MPSCTGLMHEVNFSSESDGCSCWHTCKATRSSIPRCSFDVTVRTEASSYAPTHDANSYLQSRKLSQDEAPRISAPPTPSDHPLLPLVRVFLVLSHGAHVKCIVCTSSWCPHARLAPTSSPQPRMATGGTAPEQRINPAHPPGTSAAERYFLSRVPSVTAPTKPW
jgi:hypothetical protein